MALRDNLLLSCLLLLVLSSPGFCVISKAVNDEEYLDVEASSTTGLLGAAALAPLGASPRMEHAVPPMESTRRSPEPTGSPGAAQQAMAQWGCTESSRHLVDHSHVRHRTGTVNLSHAKVLFALLHIVNTAEPHRHPYHREQTIIIPAIPPQKG